MDKKRILLVISAVIALVGIILAFTGALISSTIYDGKVSAGIGLHVVIISLIFIAAIICLYMYTKTIAGENGLTRNHIIVLGGSALSGFFFALASGYSGSATFLNDYYMYVYGSSEDAPGWYFDDVLDSDWFVWLPEIADEYASTGTMWYIVTVVAIAATAYMAYKAFRPSDK